MHSQSRARCAFCAWPYHSPSNRTDLFTEDRRREQKTSVAKAANAPLVFLQRSCCETQSLSSLSIDLIWSRNSGEFSCPCAETACCTAASSTSSSVPEIFREQFFSLG